MRNPFDTLGKPKIDNPQGEEVGGMFSCQEVDCYEASTTARYIEEASLLTWMPKCGHVNKIKDFVI